MTIEQFLALGLSFAVGVTVIRFLGPGATGALNYASAITGLLGPLATLGLESIIVREIAKGGNNTSELWQTARTMLWWVTLVNALLLAWIAATQPFSSHQQIALTATLIGSFSNLSTIHLWAFRAKARYREVARIRLVQMLLFQGIKLSFVFLGAPFIAFAALMALDPLVASITTQRMASRRLATVIGNSRPTLYQAKELLKESWPLILTGFGVMVYMKIDLIMLEAFTNIKTVGIYAAATRISEVFYIIPMILAKAAYPQMAKLRTVSPILLQRYYYTFLISMIMISLAIIISSFYFGPLAIDLIYGTSYSPSIGPFKIHIATTLPVFIGVALNNMYQIEKESKIQMYACMVGAIVNLSLNYIWIPTYGASGAAFATITSQTISIVFPIITSRRIRKIALGLHLKPFVET